MNNKQLLRHLPAVDEMMRLPEVEAIVRNHGHVRTRDTLRLVQDEFREQALSVTENIFKIDEHKDLAPQVRQVVLDRLVERAETMDRQRLKPVINGTGVLLHTNLGRAPFAPEVIDEVADLLTHYNTLEFDLNAGTRGQRSNFVEVLLKELTGCEGAVVVNNNAAAVYLVLKQWAEYGNVAVSRGELVEIGGAFRIPEVMEAGNCNLIEVGTTNRTRIGDYARLFEDEATRPDALMKVHTSNYAIMGYTESTTLEELAQLAREYDVPLIYDMGNGLIHPNPPKAVANEPHVRHALEAGADIVCFSGDKQLSGPQCGIIAGSERYIGALRNHPMMRALRVDKYTLGALEKVLTIYAQSDDINRHLPLYRMLDTSLEELTARAEKMAEALKELPNKPVIYASEARIGGGTTPLLTFPSVALCFKPTVFEEDFTPLAEVLRKGDLPIIGRFENNNFILDLRTIFPDQDDYVVARLREAFRAVGDLAKGARHGV